MAGAVHCTHLSLPYPIQRMAFAHATNRGSGASRRSAGGRSASVNVATKNQLYSSPLGPASNDGDAKALNFIQEITTNADKVQEEVLAEILTANADTEYLRRFDLGGATDRETFKTKLPVVNYEDVKPYIQRIADGDRSAILLAEPVSQFIASSGTSSGEKKLMPTTEAEKQRRAAFLGLIGPIINVYSPDLNKTGKLLSFNFSSSETRTAGGYLVSSATTSSLKSEKVRLFMRALTSPVEAILCLDYFQSMYVQMLCGLYHREEVLRLVGNFAYGILQAIRFLQLHYQELAHDISTGTLSPRITDDSLRTAVSRLLKPNPDLGQLILTECSTGNWEGILKRLWPNLKMVGAVVTGTMTQYVPALEYYSGGVPLVGNMYAASECCFGLSLNPFCKPSEISFTFMPNMGYFEFIPLDSDGGELVDLAEVEVGKEYEVVVTTYTGLYRYRVGDVLRVAGFHNAAPQFHFVRRMNVLLAVDNEVTDEVELQRGVDSAARLLEEVGTSVVEYTSYAAIEAIPGHYVIYLELLYQGLSKGPDAEVMERCCEAIEEELNARYRQGRTEHGSIGALEIRVVREGTFDELMEYAISRGASIDQYKVPRCIKLLPVVELLDSHVVSSYFSRRLPTWTQHMQRN